MLNNFHIGAISCLGNNIVSAQYDAYRRMGLVLTNKEEPNINVRKILAELVTGMIKKKVRNAGLVRETIYPLN